MIMKLHDDKFKNIVTFYTNINKSGLFCGTKKLVNGIFIFIFVENK